MRVRCSGSHVQRRCVVHVRYESPRIFSMGTAMLAMNTSSASGQEPDTHRYTTPLMIVSFCVPNSELVSMTGSTFAGIYSTIAAMRNAHVRERLATLRICSALTQRGQLT